MRASTFSIACASTYILIGVTGANAQQFTVTSFEPALAGDGVWYEYDIRANGTASTEDLTGAGGDLENNQPLPVGAALLTTGFDNADKAEVAVPDSYGLAGNILPLLNLGYSWNKASNAGQNAFAAPSIKLVIGAASCNFSDCFGTLTYEPYWQPAGVVSTPPTDTWQSETIDANTGVWWWSGGFGQSNSAGGPPLKTLNEWLALFGSDFDAAEVLLVSVGVGTYNQGQIGYFDDVYIEHTFDGGFSKSYDFEPSPPQTVDECKNGGWMNFNNPVFENQGQCVSFVVSNRGGRSR